MGNLTPNAFHSGCAAPPQPSPSMPVVISNLEILASTERDGQATGPLSFTIPMHEPQQAPSWLELLGQR